ncbi:aspartyl protease family protein [Sinobacterium caligoides]|uniref:Aspartyl protease family protein n=1 Tax=Sinobacterium caligoides TaxID=933926 RepID=A0A3N2DP81_9GAMM|nr:TIGR02281 family clan AA aspartic protease [Sinobacterium caligoides]ROS01613.1 aspartyl protease family protein [Sinobacterium caligoides]
MKLFQGCWNLPQLRCAVLLCAFLSLLPVSASWAAPSVQVKGLFKGGAILDIGGKQRMMRTGQTSPEGVTLVAANMQRAKLLIDGKNYELGLSRRISNNYVKPESIKVAIKNNGYNQFVTPGSINGRPVSFLVDTGATSVAMSAAMARHLGINYEAGKPIKIGTAGGVVDGHIIRLNSVSVGGIRVSGVEAAVSDAGLSEVLLGMSFLSHVQVSHENGVMYLTK